MALYLYIFRHGETEYNAKGIVIEGQSNFLNLNDKGKKQAEILGKRLKEESISFDEMYSSTAKRSIETAKIICKEINYPLDKINYSERLLERSQGDWEGKERLKTYDEKILNEMKENPLDFKAPNGESQREAAQRFYEFIHDEIISKGDRNKIIGINSHGNITKSFITKISNSNPSLTHNIIKNNCSISLIKYEFKGKNKEWEVIKINDDTHLENLI